jgi:hypothetical protein
MLLRVLPAVRPAFLTALAAGLALGTPVGARAQEAAQLSGLVTGPGGAPAAGARVQVTAEGGESVEALTDRTGRYRVRLPGRTDAYVVSVEAPGLSPATRVLAGAPGQGPQATLDFELALQVVLLEPLEVRVPRLTVAGATAWTPGAVDQSRPGIDLRKEPLGADDLSDLTSRQVGVAESATPDGVGISIAGQAPDQTRLTMDGADLGASVVPREAIRSVDVVTNTYDVGRGRFSGGQVDVETQRGGNEWGATARVDVRDPHFQYGDAPGALQRRQGHLALDAGGGGALLRDRVFAYGAATLRRATSSAPSLGDLDAAGLRGLRLSPDSVQRFLGLTLPFQPLAECSGRDSGLGSALVRLDAVLSERHSFMLRLNGQKSELPDRGSAWAVAGTGSTMSGSAFGVLGELSSGGARVANELRIHASAASRSWSSSDPAPAGVVTVASEADDGAPGFASLRFAGSPFAPRDTRHRGIELADELVVTTRDRSHRFRIGAEAGSQTHESLRGAAGGSFEFASLADLEAGRPARFTRPLDPAGWDAEVRRVALFADDHWRPGNLELSYGLRAERSWYSRPAAANPAVEARFGAAPGVVPASWRISPRVGFAFSARMPWDAGPEGRTAVQGGIGEFVGVLPLASLGAALAETGRPDAAELVCTGAAAPVPDWAAYRADPGAVPAACADGSSPFASRLPRATLFAPGFVPPRVWRGSLSGQGMLPSGIIWHFNASFLRGAAQSVAFDRNLRGAAGFQLGGEGGRPVYVPAEAVDPATGSASLKASRRYPEFGTVREVASDGRSRAVQLSARATRFFGQKRVVAGYTWTDARESVGAVSPPGGSQASTAGDPSQLEWAPAGYTPRHMLHAFAEWRWSARLSLTMTGRLVSGSPFTPMASGDVNGDGASNDRAFVFDPHLEGNADRALARGMEQLLDEAPAGVRDCLERHLGRVASHNSCRTPWSPSLDLTARMQFGSRVDGSPYRRLSLWFVARNVTSGLDHLLHGPDRLRGWGQPSAVDEALLFVRGFDPAARRFRYDVNPRFGSMVDHGLLTRIPFSLGIQGRIAVGSDRVVASFEEGLKTAGSRDEALSPEKVELHLRRQLPSAPAEVLALNGPKRLYLTPSQAVRLQQAADSLSAPLAEVVGALVEAVARRPGGSPVNARAVRELAKRAVEVRAAGAEAARSLLTAEQWAKLPEHVRSPAADFRPYPPERLSSPSSF